MIIDDGGRSAPHHSQKMTNIYMRLLKNLIGQIELEFRTRQSKHCGFSIYIFDNSKSKSMERLVRAEKMVLSGLVFARKIARMILI